MQLLQRWKRRSRKLGVDDHFFGLIFLVVFEILDVAVLVAAAFGSTDFVSIDFGAIGLTLGVFSSAGLDLDPSTGTGNRNGGRDGESGGREKSFSRTARTGAGAAARFLRQDARISANCSFEV